MSIFQDNKEIMAVYKNGSRMQVYKEGKHVLPVYVGTYNGTGESLLMQPSTGWTPPEIALAPLPAMQENPPPPDISPFVFQVGVSVCIGSLPGSPLDEAAPFALGFQKFDASGPVPPGFTVSATFLSRLVILDATTDAVIKTLYMSAATFGIDPPHGFIAWWWETPLVRWDSIFPPSAPSPPILKTFKILLYA